MWRAESPAFRVPAQWPSRVVGSLGAVEGGGGTDCAIACRGERIDSSASRKSVGHASHNRGFLFAEIVRTWGAACCAPTKALLAIWWWAGG